MGFDESNKTESCYGCPDRAVGCRKSCAGWKKRETERLLRYAANDQRRKGVYTSLGLRKWLLDEQTRKKRRRGRA